MGENANVGLHGVAVLFESHTTSGGPSLILD